jgi:hydrogenase expression/formation protein HypC
MCLAIPAMVVSLQKNDMATVDVGGIKKDISLSLLEDVKKGDFVLVHVGFALSKIKEEEALKTLALFKETKQL